MTRAALLGLAYIVALCVWCAYGPQIAKWFTELTAHAKRRAKEWL